MEQKPQKIPKQFTLFSTKYKVVFDNQRMHDMHTYGLCDYSTSTITLSNLDGVEKLSDDRLLDTFYHERTHAILDMMNEKDLSKNEKFVDVFSKLLRQADETSIY